MFIGFKLGLTQEIGNENEIEKTIRQLESAQVKYLLEGDVRSMKANWAVDFAVNNPFNQVQEGSSGPIQAGTLTYSLFERHIEKILIHETTAIVMGNERVVPSTAPEGSSHDTNNPIRRRFTNIWMLLNEKWLLVARHANVICVEQSLPTNTR